VWTLDASHGPGESEKIVCDQESSGSVVFGWVVGWGWRAVWEW